MVFAEIQLPAGVLTLWKKRRLDAAFDWGDASMLGDAESPMTVEEALEKMEEHAEWCKSYAGADFEVVELTSRRFSLRALINESDYSYWGPLHATMIRVAAAVGARGEYVVFTEEGDGERLVIDGTGARVECVELADLGAIETELDYEALLAEVTNQARRKRRKNK